MLLTANLLIIRSWRDNTHKYITLLINNILIRQIVFLCILYKNTLNSNNIFIFESEIPQFDLTTLLI